MAKREAVGQSGRQVDELGFVASRRRSRSLLHPPLCRRLIALTMLNGSTVFAAAIGYVLALFALAYWGDHGGRRFLVGSRRTLVYALSLAVYCTSWTYYGSVGIASAHGFDFLPIYIGPVLVIGFGYRLVRRIVELTRAQNLTTVADFVAARYGKSQIVASLSALHRADGGRRPTSRCN